MCSSICSTYDASSLTSHSLRAHRLTLHRSLQNEWKLQKISLCSHWLFIVGRLDGNVRDKIALDSIVRICRGKGTSYFFGIRLIIWSLSFDCVLPLTIPLCVLVNEPSEATLAAALDRKMHAREQNIMRRGLTISNDSQAHFFQGCHHTFVTYCRMHI